MFNWFKKKTNAAAEITKQTKVPPNLPQAKPRLIWIRLKIARDLANFIETNFETCDPIFKMASLDARGVDLRL